MPKRLIDTAGRPLLDIASYARKGPGRRDHFSQAELDSIRRTVIRTPEVMVKVLTRGANTLQAAREHLAYLTRAGELGIDTDFGDQLQGRDAYKALLDNWDLDLDQVRRRPELRRGNDRVPPKLVHKVLFSMPPGTPPRKVLQAVRNFAREEFGGVHRYAMVLHTDEPHPHVHMVVKALSEQGERLHIRKATLRRWRAGFASHLRLLGVPANATERAVRGAVRPSVSDGVYRTSLRGESTVLRDRQQKSPHDDVPGANRLRATRGRIQHGWAAVAQVFRDLNQFDLADRIDRNLAEMPAPQTAREQFLHQQIRLHTQQRESPSPAR